MLSGRYRDPLVGRSILAGGVCMAGVALLNNLAMMGINWLELRPARPIWQPSHFEVMDGVRQALGVFIGHHFNFAVLPIGILFVLVGFRVMFRRQWQWLAVIGLVVVFSLPGALSPEATFWYNGLLNLLVWSGLAFVLIRFGLLSVVAWMAFNFAYHLPIIPDPSVWFFGRSVAGLLLLAVLAGYGFWISLAGRPLFARDLLEEPA